MEKSPLTWADATWPRESLLLEAMVARGYFGATSPTLAPPDATSSNFLVPTIHTPNGVKVPSQPSRCSWEHRKLPSAIADP